MAATQSEIQACKAGRLLVQAGQRLIRSFPQTVQEWQEINGLMDEALKALKQVQLKDVPELAEK